MNEQPLTVPSRSAVASRFFNSLHRYKNLLLSKWWVLLLCAAASLGALAALKWNAPPEYQSVGRMIVGSKTALPSGGGYTEEMNNFYGTQMALMQSDTVSNRAAVIVQVEHTNFHPCAVDLKVTVSPKTSIFNLKAVGLDAEYSQAFLAATMSQYIKVKQEMRGRMADSTKEAIQAEIQRLGLEVQKGKQALVDYQSSNSVVFLQDQGNSAGVRLAELTHQQANLKSELQLLKMLTLDENVERQLTMAQQNISKAPQSSPSAQEMKQEGAQVGITADNKNTPGDQATANVGLVGSQTEYLKAKQQIMLLQGQRAELSEFLRPKHPKIVALDEDIARKEKLLDLFRNQSQEQLGNLQHSLELQIQNLDSEIKVWEGKSLDISKKMAEYQTIKEDNLRVQNMYDRLVTVDYSIETDKSMSQESVSILEEATPPTTVPPQIIKWATLAMILGLGLGMSILLVVDHLDDRPTSLVELQEIVEEEVLGQIPRVHSKDKSSPGILQEEDDRHAMVEAYRNLRSSVTFLGTAEKRPRTLVVTSAIPGDGKSMTSANLAITLARSGAKVILVDADLRRGVMHTRFGVRNNPGFSEVLLGQCPWREALVSTGIPNLTLIPRGSTNRHPGELFVTPAKNQFTKEAAGLFDYLIFDTAPVMAADDVSNLAPQVDGVIMVIRANYTSGRVARAALDLLYQRKANILGVVFNAVRSHSSEYYYYHYKDYYAKNPTA